MWLPQQPQCISYCLCLSLVCWGCKLVCESCFFPTFLLHVNQSKVRMVYDTIRTIFTGWTAHLEGVTYFFLLLAKHSMANKEKQQAKQNPQRSVKAAENQHNKTRDHTGSFKSVERTATQIAFLFQKHKPFATLSETVSFRQCVQQRKYHGSQETDRSSSSRSATEWD